jgi:GNAT superfamily N-acetyltransferase
MGETKQLIKSGASYHLKDLVRLGKSYYESSPYVHTHQFDGELLLDNLRKYMIYPVAEIAVAEWDNRVVGGAVAYMLEYTWTPGVRVNMEFFYVDPEYRQYGLAEALLEHQLAWAKQQNAMEFIAGDLGLNPKALQKFFEQQGFQDPGMLIRKVL